MKQTRPTHVPAPCHSNVKTNPSSHLNEARPINSRRSNSVIALKSLTGPLDQRGNSQTIRKPRREREAGFETIGPRDGGDVGNGHRHRHIGSGEVDDRIGRGTDDPRHGELERHVLGLRRGDDGQGAERGQIDTGQRLGARTGDDEHLDRSESEAGGSTRQERRGRGRLLLREAVEAHLLAFLGQDGAEQWDQGALVTSVGGKYGLSFGQGAQDDVGKGLGEGDGLVKGGDWELVLTGFDGSVVGGC